MCVCVYVYMYVYMFLYDVCAYKKFMRLFFCVYPVHISMGQYCQKMLKLGGFKKTEWRRLAV